MYLCHITGCTSLYQGIHQYYDPQDGSKSIKYSPLSLYRVNEPRTYILILYLDVTLEVGDKLEFMDIIEYTKKGYKY